MVEDIQEKRNLVDLNTGESFDSVIVPRKGWTPNPYGKRWFMYAQDSAQLFMRDKDLPTRVRVYFFFLNRLDFANLIHYSQKDICDELNLTRSSVWKGIQWLLDEGVIVKGPCSSFRLNDNFGWKGKIKDLNKHRSERTPL